MRITNKLRLKKLEIRKWTRIDKLFDKIFKIAIVITVGLVIISLVRR